MQRRVLDAKRATEQVGERVLRTGCAAIERGRTRGRTAQCVLARGEVTRREQQILDRAYDRRGARERVFAWVEPARHHAHHVRERVDEALHGQRDQHVARECDVVDDDIGPDLAVAAGLLVAPAQMERSSSSGSLRRSRHGMHRTARQP